MNRILYMTLTLPTEFGAVLVLIVDVWRRVDRYARRRKEDQ